MASRTPHDSQSTSSGAIVDPSERLTPTRLARFSRQIILPGFGVTAQERLQAARVLVVGAGGLGSSTIPALAGAGIGTIGIIDDDAVELSNLHRQVAHGVADIGRLKVDSLAESVAAIDPEVRVVRHPVRLTSANALEILADYDLVVDGSDNFATRYLTNDAAELSGKPLVWGAILRWDGQAGVAWAGHGPTYRDLFPVPPSADTVLSCELGGVLPAVCAVIGSILAGETVKLITGAGEPLLGRVTTYDALTGRFRELQYSAIPDAEPVRELIDYDAFCGVSQGGAVGADSYTPDGMSVADLADLLSGQSELQVVDVREAFETAITTLPRSESIPLRELEDALERIRTDVPVVLYCHHGPRSIDGVRRLRTLGRDNITYLIGGVDAYAAIDTSIIRY
jgi:adenylyltransferase/sulfurtransferase